MPSATHWRKFNTWNPMRLRKCKRCGKPYETDRPDTYLCPVCSVEAKRETVVRDRICRQCSVVFPGGPHAWYCPTCRAERRQEVDRRRKRTGPSRPLGSTDTCKRCGGEYVVEAGRQVYCKRCAEIAVRETVRAHKRRYNAENRDSLNAHKKAMRTDRNVCIICGNVFDADTATVTCSTACAAKLRKQRQEEADIRRGKRKSPVGVKYDSGLPKSGIVGVTARRNGKWQASYNGRYIGIYENIPAAAAALEKYKEEHKNDG